MIATQIDRLNREFFWEKSNTVKEMALVAWGKICTPKEKSGLGLHKIAALNIAFQCKLAWKILTEKENIWVRIV